ncbi:MAG TPA: hypothetical protein ENO23_04400, partial [Alphaproteobacteria bacterium]|nr:hypothetical protein [Alphaproteobacteria bacterium]
MLRRSYAALVPLPLALVLALVLFMASSAGAITYTTLVLSGDPAPGTGGGFTTFSPPQINDSGAVVFTGSANAFAEQGIWIVDNGSVSNVMLTVTPAPGTGLTFTTTRSKIKIANGGDAGGYHRLTDYSVLYDSLWRGPPGAYAAVTIEDEVDPGGFVAILDDLMMFDDGSNAFQANTITNGSLTRGNYFVSDTNGSTLVAREGLTAPGTAVAFTRVYAAAAANEVGGIAFRGELSATSDANQGLWMATEAGAVLLAREGDPVPGLGTDVFTGTAGD